MAQFKYIAIDPTGQEMASEIDAADEKEALTQLSSKSLTVVELSLMKGGKDEDDKEDQKSDSKLDIFAKAVPMAVILMFYEQLSFLLGAGIPLHLSLRMAMENIKNAELTKILRTMLFDLTEGSMLSVSFQKFPKVFPSLHAHIVGIGEKTGSLDKALLQLVDLTKERLEIEKQAVGAASYPLFLVGTSLTLSIGMVAFVFPKFEDIFSSFGNKLPALTQTLLNVSHFINNNSTTFFGSVGAIIAGVAYFLMASSMGETREKLMIHTPLISDVFISFFVAQLTKTLSSTLRSGIPLLEALIIVRRTVPAGLRQDFITEMIEAVREGETLSHAMERTRFVPELVWQLTAVGEKTGNLGVIMENIFLFYKRRYNELLEKLTAVMKPTLMFGSAIVIGAMAGALFIPLFKMGGNMKRGD